MSSIASVINQRFAARDTNKLILKTLCLDISLYAKTNTGQKKLLFSYNQCSQL